MQRRKKIKEEAMEKLLDTTCEKFLEELASKQPTPGGGAASALCGATAAALTAMLGNLTAGKAGSEANDKMALEIIIAADKLRLELAQLADDDAAVFNKFMEAYKMPKATDTEKAMRTAAIGQAAIAAAEVPMQIADKSLEVLKLARKLIVFGNPNAISDGTVSALMARAALRSALYNVKINLGLIKDDEYVAAARAKMQQLEAKAMEIEAFVLARTDEVLK